MSVWDEPGRYDVSISENKLRRFTPWDWSVRDNATGVERFGRSSREAWARADAEKAIRKMREASK